MTSCHVRVAVGLVAPPLRSGAKSRVKNLDMGCPLGVCTALGARSIRMSVASSTAMLVCVVCIYVRTCVSM